MFHINCKSGGRENHKKKRGSAMMDEWLDLGRNHLHGQNTMKAKQQSLILGNSIPGEHHKFPGHT